MCLKTAWVMKVLPNKNLLRRGNLDWNSYLDNKSGPLESSGPLIKLTIIYCGYISIILIWNAKNTTNK